MEGGINPYATLDYVEIQIFPAQHRYAASAWSSNREEKVASGPLEQLFHSPQVKELSSKGFNTNFKILPPHNVNDADWFTTATFKRFLHIIGLPKIRSIGNEISQLEQTRKFHLSLSEEAEVDLTVSVESKNELLRAVDLRLTALKEELAAAFNEATGSKCSPKDISDLGNFALHFGAKNLRDSLSTISLLNDSRNKNINKFAENERQNSTDDEDSAFSSEEDQPSLERSLSLARSAKPKRSISSPMRRIQIGRSGSRRAASLSIKSLNYFPSREKHADNSSEEEDSEKTPKNNVLRMSVQDKISLFESKQIDQGVDIQKKRMSLNATFGLKKAVLRRWSSGMGESASQSLPDSSTNTSSPISPKNVASDDKAEPGKRSSEQLGAKADTRLEREESGEKHTDSIEWNQQKGAELNELFMKMMENKPVRRQNVTTDNSKRNNLKDQRVGFYDLYKQKREEKLQMEDAGKRIEKEAQFKVMPRSVPKTVSSGVNRRQTTVNEPQKTQKNATQLVNSRTSQPSTVKRATSKSSPLPSTCKSCPSTPSPSKSPAGPALTSRKPQSASSVVRSSPKVESLQPKSKTVKAPQPDSNKRIKPVNEKKQQPVVTKNTTTTKAKVRTPKKSSVVPLETKPFLRKGSGTGPGVSPVIKTKVVTHPEENLKSPGGLKVVITTGLTLTSQTRKNERETQENRVVSPTKWKELENSNELDNDLKRFEVSSEEELGISPSAWVEIEDNHQNENEIVSCEESPIEIVSPANVDAPAGYSRPRGRHSLSMLLEERNDEWGKAEHPPTMVYQKDAPKGFKRLLKFARKTKCDSHPTGFSEGEDDAEKSKGQLNLSRFIVESHRRVIEGHVPASINTTKATRSFFSLSAFRGSKTNKTKLPYVNEN